jgi:hypothetical protein
MKPGLYENIAKKRERIEAGSKEKMRKVGSKGAPTAADFKAAAKTAYRLGRRPPNQPNASLDDVFKLMDENSSVNLVSPKMQQTFNPAPTSTFDNTALTGAKALAKIDQITGLPLNADGTVTLFHHTNKNAAQSIQKTGVLKSAGEPSVYLTTERTPTTGYGDTVVPVKVNPSKLNLDDEFPNGRLDFSIDVGKPGGSVKVAPVPSFVAPQDEALRLAQQRASLPPAQGGLGLPAGNTPEQRAAAMGGKEMTHFSRHGGDFSVLDSGQYAQAPFDAVGTHVGSKEAALERFRNTTGTTDQIKGVTYPVNMLGKNPLMNPEGHAWTEDELSAFLRKEGGHNVQSNLTYPQMNAALRKKLFEDQGYTSIPYVNEVENKGVISHIVPPENLRSRFAAYDPLRKTAAIAAAAGLAAPDLLAGQAPQQAPKFDNSALMK